MGNIINLQDFLNKASMENCKEYIEQSNFCIHGLLLFKIRSMQLSGPHGNPIDFNSALPYSEKEISDAIYKAVCFVESNIDPDDINRITMIHDEITTLALEDLAGKSMITIRDFIN